MNARDFLGAVFNADRETLGTVIIAKKLGDSFAHYGHESIAEAANEAARISGFTSDAYFAPALFKDFNPAMTKGNRVSEKAMGACSFWLDIDVGDKKVAEGNGYATQQEALEALRDFCAATGLPRPSPVISSGYGVHVYWLMSEFVPRERWLEAARMLKVLTIAHKLLVDQSRTADIASVLRPVGTRNFKNPAMPQTVAALHPRDGAPPRRVDLAKFEVLLDAAVHAQAAAGVAPHQGLGGKGGNILPRDLPQETPGEIAKVRAMLAAIDPDCDRAKWRQVVWAALSTGWDCAEQLTRQWSERGAKWNEGDFERIVGDFDPARGTGYGTLVYHAKAAGYEPPLAAIAVKGAGSALDGEVIGPGSAALGQLATLADFNSRFFVAPLGGGTFIFDRTSEKLIGEAMTEAAFKLRFLPIHDGKSDPRDNKRVPLAKKWLGWPQRATYDRIVFNPSGKACEGEYNSWRGLTIEPRGGDCGRILAHIRDVWCNGDPAQFGYVLKWMALLVQKPGVKPEVALVLRSREGTGKTIIVKVLLDILGIHGFTTAQKDQVAGRFNGHLFDKVLVVLEEAFFAGDPEAVAAAKALITNAEIGYEAKGKDAFSAPNYAHVIVLTNNEWAVPAGEDSRRWMVLEVSEARTGDHAYFKKLAREIANGGDAAFLSYLLSFNLGGFNPRILPRSDALRAQKVRTLYWTDPVTAWWLDVLTEGEFPIKDGAVPWSPEILAADLQESYSSATTRVKGAPSFVVAAKKLRRLVPAGALAKTRKTLNAERFFSYVLPDLTEAREHFENVTGIDPCAA